MDASAVRRSGQPDRLRHDGRHPDRCSWRSARHGRVVVSVARVNARRASQDVRHASSQSVLEPAGRCPWWRRRMSEIGVVQGEGCSSRRGAGSPSLEAPRGAAPRRATTRVSWSTRKQDC